MVSSKLVLACFLACVVSTVWGQSNQTVTCNSLYDCATTGQKCNFYNGVSYRCIEHSYCDQSNTTTCLAQKQDGEPCVNTFECINTCLYASGQCGKESVRQNDVGDYCQSNGNCRTFLKCVENKCTAASEGQLCGFTYDCASPNVCIYNYSSNNNGGICTAPVPIGQPCSTRDNNKEPCVFGAFCQPIPGGSTGSGVCVSLSTPKDGDVCTANNQCPDGSVCHLKRFGDPYGNCTHFPTATLGFQCTRSTDCNTQFESCWCTSNGYAVCAATNKYPNPTGIRAAQEAMYSCVAQPDCGGNSFKYLNDSCCHEEICNYYSIYRLNDYRLKQLPSTANPACFAKELVEADIATGIDRYCDPIDFPPPTPAPTFAPTPAPTPGPSTSGMTGPAPTSTPAPTPGIPSTTSTGTAPSPTQAPTPGIPSTTSTGTAPSPTQAPTPAPSSAPGTPTVAPTPAPVIVTQVQIAITVTAQNISTVNLTDIRASVAASLGTTASNVNITLVFVPDRKRDIGGHYEIVVTVLDVAQTNLADTITPGNSNNGQPAPVTIDVAAVINKLNNSATFQNTLQQQGVVAQSVNVEAQQVVLPPETTTTTTTATTTSTTGQGASPVSSANSFTTKSFPVLIILVVFAFCVFII